MLSNLYLGSKLGPEQQFVAALAERKKAALQAARPAASALFACDFTFRVALQESKWDDQEVSPPTWRRLRCSGGITLRALADKVLSPAMGWCRNFHFYMFTDRSDGAQFGAPDSGAIDQMHLGYNGWLVMDDQDVRLAELLQTPGEALNYLYDLGDGWSHKLTLEAVADAASSTGACELLDGGGACPPEDSTGLAQMGVHNGFAPLLRDAAAAAGGDAAAARRVVKARLAAASALNYSGPEHAISLRLYPTGFDLPSARARLAAALSSRASVPSGAKQFTTPLSADFGPDHLAAYLTAGPDTRAVATLVGARGSFMTETLRTARDDAATALCNACGSPANLKVCARCRVARYCSAECQKRAWKAGHKEECVKPGKDK